MSDGQAAEVMSRPLAKGWQWIQLGKYVENLDGRRVPVSQRERETRRGDFPYYGASGVIDSIDGHTHDGEFVLIGEDGANLLTRSKPIAFQAKGKIWVNNHAHVLRCKPGYSNAYLAYYINSIDLSPYVTGTAQPKLSQSMMNKIPVPVAPPEQQVEIVAEIEKQFSRLDEAVANLQRVKANLKRYKDSIYAEAFGNSPNCTLGDLIDVGPQNGLYLPKDMYGAGVPILRIDDYQTSWIRPAQDLRCVKALSDQISTWGLFEDDLVVNRVNSMTHIGKCVRIPRSLAGAVFESNMMRMRLKATVSPAYVEHYLASRLGKKRLTENAKWAVNQASINQKDVRATRIFLPDLSEQLKVVAEVDRHLSIIREVEAEVDANVQRAQVLRQATLAKAFNNQSGGKFEIHISTQ